MKKNWKTTLAAIIVAGVAAANALGWINAETAQGIIAAAAAIGLAYAKDSNVTGGTKKQ